MSLYMHVYFISLFYTKKGRRILRVFIYAYLFSYLMYICFVLFMQKGEKYLESLFMFISSFMHICVVWFMYFIEYLFVYCYAWVKGELLWSLSLIHAYITLWVLSSSKRERLFQRPITLVVMMINSYSYNTNDLVSYSFRFTIKILVGV